MIWESHYKVLGVARNASADEIRKAYLGLALDYHPDYHPGDKKKAERFTRINEARDVLSDPQKREAYDFLIDHQITPERLKGLVTEAVSMAIEELFKTPWGEKIEAAAAFLGAKDLRTKLVDLACMHAQKAYDRMTVHPS